MKKKFFSGDSVQQALLQAARHFQAEPEEIAYREVDRRHGFLRGRRRAVIEVDTDSPVRSAEASPETPPVAREGGSAVEEKPAATAPPAEKPAGKPREPREPSAEAPTEELPREMLDDLAERGAPPAPGADEPPAQAGVASPPAARPVEAAAPAVPVTQPASEELSEAARQALGRIFELGRLNLEVEKIEQGEEKLEIELRGEDEELLLEDRGRLLLAIQHLLPRMLRGLTGSSTPCQVDCDDFHEIRTEQLRDLAQRVASEVRNHRRSRTLEPMSPDERRIVHLTLADDPAVETVSQGNGLFKRVQIRPQRMQPRGFDPFGGE